MPQPPPEDFEYPSGAFPDDPLRALTATAVREFEEAAGSDDAIRRALCRYFKRGYAAKYDNGELVDYLCVSNNLLEEAGLDAKEVARILKDILPAISDREIAKTALDSISAGPSTGSG
jgi:hypothetical protein